MKIGSILLLFLSSTLILPLGFSGMQASGQLNDNNQNSAGTNQTISFGFSNQTNPAFTENIGLQISNFVHNATLLFQQQRNETIQAIQDCHQNLRTATSDNRTQIIDECHATLNAIREKYQDARNQFQELFKEFRESIITLRHQAEGLHVSQHDQANAISNINGNASKHGLTGINIALGHMKGMGENGRIGIGRALQHVNETGLGGQPQTQYTPTMPSTPMHPNPPNHGGMQGTPSSTTTTPIPQMPVQPPNEGSHGPPGLPGQSGSHGRH